MDAEDENALAGELFDFCDALSRRDPEVAAGHCVEVLTRDAIFLDENDRPGYVRAVVDVARMALQTGGGSRGLDTVCGRRRPSLFDVLRVHASATASKAIGAVAAARWTIWAPTQQADYIRLGHDAYARLSREQGTLLIDYVAGWRRAYVDSLREELARLRREE